MHRQNLVKFYQFKIFSRNEILKSLKGNYPVTIVPKIMCNNPNLDLVNVYTKFSKILLNCYQYIERKGTYDRRNDRRNDRQMG